MKTHRFEGIRYEFVPGGEIVPYLAPHESRRLFGGAEGPVHTHAHDRYVAVDPETGHVHGRSPVRAHSAPASRRRRMNARDDGAAVPVTATHLARMLQFGDSMFPIGGFSFSGGLESAIQTARGHRRRHAARVRAHRGRAGGSRRRHRARLRASRGARGRPRTSCSRIDARVSMRASSPARRGRCPCAWAGSSPRWARRSPARRRCWTGATRIEAGATPGCYPVALAVIFAAQGLPARDAFVVHQYGVATTILGAALRLMRISHVDTQAILFELNADADTPTRPRPRRAPRRHGGLRAAGRDPGGRPRQGARAPVHELKRRDRRDDQ